jgi:hypothetical protein
MKRASAAGSGAAVGRCQQLTGTGWEAEGGVAGLVKE